MGERIAGIRARVAGSAVEGPDPGYVEATFEQAIRNVCETELEEGDVELLVNAPADIAYLLERVERLEAAGARLADSVSMPAASDRDEARRSGEIWRPLFEARDAFRAALESS